MRLLLFVALLINWQASIPVLATFESMPCSESMYTTTFDYVVVGTGPASGPVIRRLADAGFSVLVLEKGPYFAQQDQPGQGASKPDTQTQPMFDDQFQVDEVVHDFDTNIKSLSGIFSTAEEQKRRQLVRERPLAEALGVRHDFFTSSLRMDLASVSIDSIKRRRRYPYAQVQGFGGNLLTYGGLHLRPSPAAFSSWPQGFSYQDMLPWYEKMEAFSFACGSPNASMAHNCLSPEGFIHVNLQREADYPSVVSKMPLYCSSGRQRRNWLNTCGSADAVDYNGAYPTRAFCGPPQFSAALNLSSTPPSLTRDTLQQTYLPKAYLEISDNIFVCLSARVRRLFVDNPTGRITGAQVAGSERVVSGLRFVLVAGVRHTPEILMSSGIGDPAVLSQFGVPVPISLPSVGINFHDEWAYALSFTVVNNSNGFWIPSQPSTINRDQLHLVKFASSAQPGGLFTDVQLYLRLANRLTLDLYLPSADFGAASYGDSFTVRVAMFQIDTFGNNSGIKPINANGLYVDRFHFSVDMFQTPELLERFLVGAWEGFNETMQMLNILTTAVDPWGQNLSFVPSPVTAALILAAQRGVDEFREMLLDSANVLALHGGGTCRMGDCVDSNFKLFGSPNLYVCDMSVFPNPVDANPTATLFALGERLADQLISFPLWTSCKICDQNQTCCSCQVDHTSCSCQMPDGSNVNFKFPLNKGSLIRATNNQEVFTNVPSLLLLGPQHWGTRFVLNANGMNCQGRRFVISHSMKLSILDESTWSLTFFYSDSSGPSPLFKATFPANQSSVNFFVFGGTIELGTDSNCVIASNDLPLAFSVDIINRHSSHGCLRSLPGDRSYEYNVNFCTSALWNYVYDISCVSCSYVWATSPYGDCSVPCGGGVSTRNVTCRGCDGNVYNDTACSSVGPKPASSQTCNTQRCSVMVNNTGSLSVGGGCSMTVSSNAVLDVLPWSVSFWMKTSMGYSDNGGTGILNKYIASSNNGWQVLLYGNNISAFYVLNWHADVEDGKPHSKSPFVYDGIVYFTGNVNVRDGRWHHVAVTVTQQAAFIYVDGVVDVTTTSYTLSGPVTTITPFEIGYYNGGDLPYYDGLVDDISIWNAELTAEHVSLLYNGTLPLALANNVTSPNCTSSRDSLDRKLIAYYNCDPDPASPYAFVDLGPYAMNATINLQCTKFVSQVPINIAQLNNSVPCMTGYSWAVGGYGNCSVTCGGGVQVRNVTCMGSDGRTYNDSMCSSVGPKPASSQTCNNQSCTPVVESAASHFDGSCFFSISPAYASAINSLSAQASVSFWARNPSQSRLLGCAQLSGPNYGWAAGFIGNLRIIFTTFGYIDYSVAIDPKFSSDSQWHFYAMAFDGGSVVFYVDGANVGTSTGSSSISSYQASLRTCYVGAINYSPDIFENFVGDLFQPAIFSAAISQTSVSAMFGGALPSSVSSVLTWYQLGNQIQYTGGWPTLIDQSGSATAVSNSMSCFAQSASYVNLSNICLSSQQITRLHPEVLQSQVCNTSLPLYYFSRVVWLQFINMSMILQINGGASVPKVSLQYVIIDSFSLHAENPPILQWEEISAVVTFLHSNLFLVTLNLSSLTMTIPDSQFDQLVDVAVHGRMRTCHFRLYVNETVEFSTCVYAKQVPAPALMTPQDAEALQNSSIVIVGAGFAGLAAAKALISGGSLYHPSDLLVVDSDLIMAGYDDIVTSRIVDEAMTFAISELNSVGDLNAVARTTTDRTRYFFHILDALIESSREHDFRRKQLLDDFSKSGVTVLENVPWPWLVAQLTAPTWSGFVLDARGRRRVRPFRDSVAQLLLATQLMDLHDPYLPSEIALNVWAFSYAAHSLVFSMIALGFNVTITVRYDLFEIYETPEAKRTMNDTLQHWIRSYGLQAVIDPTFDYNSHLNHIFDILFVGRQYFTGVYNLTSVITPCSRVISLLGDLTADQAVIYSLKNLSAAYYTGRLESALRSAPAQAITLLAVEDYASAFRTTDPAPNGLTQFYGLPSLGWAGYTNENYLMVKVNLLDFYPASALDRLSNFLVGRSSTDYPWELTAWVDPQAMRLVGMSGTLHTPLILDLIRPFLNQSLETISQFVERLAFNRGNWETDLERVLLERCLAVVAPPAPRLGLPPNFDAQYRMTDSFTNVSYNGTFSRRLSAFRVSCVADNDTSFFFSLWPNGTSDALVQWLESPNGTSVTECYPSPIWPPILVLLNSAEWVSTPKDITATCGNISVQMWKSGNFSICVNTAGSVSSLRSDNRVIVNVTSFLVVPSGALFPPGVSPQANLGDPTTRSCSAFKSTASNSSPRESSELTIDIGIITMVFGGLVLLSALVWVCYWKKMACFKSPAVEYHLLTDVSSTQRSV